MTHHLLNYPQKMRGAGYRVTPQRKTILDAICEAGHGVTVEEIILRLRKKTPALDRATVYRNLIFLQKLHLVQAAGSGKARRFEIASVEPHHHLICRECGAETGLDRKVVERLRSTIQNEFQFIIDNDHLSFQGLCSQCAYGGSRKSRRVSGNSRQG
jgi:Fur family ferric uptake transcriptional regulator